MPVQLKNNIPRHRREMRTKTAGGVNDACQFWVDTATEAAPEDTGRLKAGIGQVREATPNRLEGAVASAAPYSAAVNQGTSKRASNPFWTRAYLLTRQKFLTFFK